MKAPVLIAVALGLHGCATAPVSDLAPGERPELDSDEAGLWQAMERDEFTLRTSPAVIREPGLQQYLESVLCRVAPDYCEEIRIYVIPSPHFNAAMGPNGVMLVFTGLLLRIENEAQLAAIMGHEVGHYQRRHSLQRLRAWRSRAAGIQTVAAVLSAGTAIASANANAALAAGDLSAAASQAETAYRIANAGTILLDSLQIWSVLSQLQYSREHETESDDLGLHWLAVSGYDPGVVVDLWEYMKREDELSDSRFPGYLRTHPLSEDRMTRSRLRAVELHAVFPGSLETGAYSFRQAIDPHRNEWLRSARVGLAQQSEELLLERQRSLGVDPGLVLFHEADMHRKRDQLQNTSLALNTYRHATQYPGVPPEAYREIGLLLWERDETEGARSAFNEYIAQVPTAPDVQLIRSYVEELTE